MTPVPAAVGRPRFDDVASRGGAIGAAVAVTLLAIVAGRIDFDDGANRWFAPAAIATAVAVGVALPTMRRAVPTPGVGAAAVLVAAVATYLCVPETDQFQTVWWLPVGVLVAELVLRRPLGIEWYGAAAIPIGWAGMFGVDERFSAMAGMLFAWWVVLLVPLVASVSPLAVRSGAAHAVMVVGAVATIAGVRTGGIADGRVSTALWLGAIAAGSLVASALLAVLSDGRAVRSDVRPERLSGPPQRRRG